MKAIVCTRYGPPEVLQLQEVEKPAPKANEVLVKVHAATVTRGDVLLRGLTFSPLFWPPVRAILGLPPRKKIPGHEFAGVIEAAGAEVSRFKPGDAVFGTTTGLTVGANAEYVCLPEAWPTGVLARKPANLAYAEAAALPVGAMTALQLLRKGGIGSGQSALVNGASGSVGTYAVQLARQFGAEVTGVCSAANVELLQSLGAHKVIDYAKGDFTASSETYDLIFDAVGKTSSSRGKRVLNPDGRFVSVASSTKESTADLLFLKQLAEAGGLRPVIDRCFPLAQTAEAHRYVETGRKRGNVVIALDDMPS
jgi:NADPH:quinone reductase-like Zn-dependent oxidoreductase